MSDPLIYHICRADEWDAAKQLGGHRSAQDIPDGFVHFSTRSQIRKSAAKHRSGQTDLLLIAVDPNRLGSALRWEPSRDGMLFPHLYAALDPSLVSWTRPLPLGADGTHIFPEFFQDIEEVS